MNIKKMHKDLKQSNYLQSVQLAQQEVGVSKHLHLTHLNLPTLFELANGQVGCTVRVQGVAFDTATHDELNQYKRIQHHAVCVLGDAFCIVEHTMRRKMDVHLDGAFEDEFTRTVDWQYHQQFRHTQLYANELYITILYKGIDSGKFGKTANWLNKISHRAVKQARTAWRTQAIDKLNKAVQQFMAMLTRFKPTLLGSHDEQLGYSELLSFYGVFVNGLEAIPFNIPSKTGYSQNSLHNNVNINRQNNLNKNSNHQQAEQQRVNKKTCYPHSNLAEYLPAKRLFFADYIEFRGASNQSSYGAMLSLKIYGTDTAPIMLDPLLKLDGEFIYTNSFAIEANDVAQNKIIKQLVRMDNANDPAQSQMQQLALCRDDLASGRLRVGYHHNSIMLIADEIEPLQELVNKAIKAYSDIGFVAIQETIGMEAAFWAQIPGNQQYIVRQNLITSQNFVDFCPLHNYRTGYRDSNHLGSAITLIETPSKTPLFFNYHAKGSGDKNDLTPGHTTIIGGNGSGKTVFMGFIDSQMSRYGGRSYFFDRDRGCEIYIRATGGHYAIISPDHPNDSQFNPFCLDDTPKNRSFLKQWLAQLIKEEQETQLPAAIDSAVSECVDYGYDALEKNHRRLSNVIQILPINFPRWDRLKKWLRSDGISNDGEYAYLFDNQHDTLSLNKHQSNENKNQLKKQVISNREQNKNQHANKKNSVLNKETVTKKTKTKIKAINITSNDHPTKIGFDMTELMQQPKSVLTAVCMYLVHQIKNALDGQRVSIYFDEGWQILDNPYWKQQLKQDLPTLRKLNAHIILATQSPESVVQSALSAQFLDNCATNLFFCNAKADYQKHYQQFNISSSEFEFIKYTPAEYRLFLYKQSEQSAICKLNLTGMDDALAVYSANKATIKLLDEIRKEVSDDPKAWLPEFHYRRRLLETRN